VGERRHCYVIGYPAKHSLSPVMFRAAFAALQLNWTYEALEVEPVRLGAVLRELAHAGTVGINVTMPHKERVWPYLVRATERASTLGAVNVLTWSLPGGRQTGRDGVATGDQAASAGPGWEGDNTDWPGISRALREAGVRDASPEPVERCADLAAVLFGAGGAGRAAAFALTELGFRVTVVNRDHQRGQRLARLIDGSFLAWADASLPELLQKAHVVVNATPLGMGDTAGLGQDSPLPPRARLRPGVVACDLVYNPVETLFLRQAGEQGARCVNGLEVLLWQGVLAFERWTGQQAPVQAMRAALKQGGGDRR